MERNDRRLLTFAAIVGAYITGAIVATVCVQAPLGKWLYDFQALVAGLLALAGAGVTIWQVRAQIAQTQTLADQEKAAESYAARSILPLSLSQLCEYAEECLRVEKEVLDVRGTSASLTVSLPRIPTDLIGQLEYTIRYASKPNAKSLADLVAHLQIQQSRLRSLQVEIDSVACRRFRGHLVKLIPPFVRTQPG